MEDLAAEVYLALVRLTRSLRREVRRDVPGGTLSVGSLSALSALSKCGPLRPTALAEVEGVAAASMTRILRALEGEELVRRTPDPTDGRAQLVELTDRGARLVRQGTEATVEAVRRRMATLAEADVAALLAALGPLARLGEA